MISGIIEINLFLYGLQKVAKVNKSTQNKKEKEII